MSIDQIDEFEQGERVRAWLKNNGSSLLTGIALGLAGIASWNWWQARMENGRVEAAAQYAEFTAAATAKNEDKLRALEKAIAKDYPDTPYPLLSALRMAEFLQSKGKPKDALAVLDGVDRSKQNALLAELLDLRAARLQLQLGQVDAAVKRLDSIKGTGFAAVADELRGDAEIARGNRDAARKAYADALSALDVTAPTRPLLLLKLTDAGGRAPDQPET